MAKTAKRSHAPKSLAKSARERADRPSEIAEGLGAGAAEFQAAVTGYATSLVRTGADADFLGWITLIGTGGNPAGYVYLRKPLQAPQLSSAGDYLILDWLPEQLDSLLCVLRSGEPLRLRYSGGYAFLERR